MYHYSDVEDYLTCNAETMRLLICPGFELTFYSGVYGTCLGAMTQFGDDAKGLIGLSGILIGVGEILGKSVHYNYCASVLSGHGKCNKQFSVLNQEGEYLVSWISVIVSAETQWCFLACSPILWHSTSSSST